MGRFWADALGLAARPQERPGVVAVHAGDVPVLWIHATGRAKTVKNRVHPDLHVPDPDRLLRLGATPLADHDGWRVLADPEGNEFCAFPATADDGPPATPFAICVDSDRPVELAAWWAARTGVEPGPGPDGTPRWLPGIGWGPFEIIWKFVPVTDARVAENRLYWDVLADPAELRAAGARLVRPAGGSITWTVLHDPQGNLTRAFGPR